jgi:hypothetical protein
MKMERSDGNKGKGGADPHRIVTLKREGGSSVGFATTTRLNEPYMLVTGVGEDWNFLFTIKSTGDPGLQVLNYTGIGEGDYVGGTLRHVLLEGDKHLYVKEAEYSYHFSYQAYRSHGTFKATLNLPDGGTESISGKFDVDRIF